MFLNNVILISLHLYTDINSNIVGLATCVKAGSENANIIQTIERKVNKWDRRWLALSLCMFQEEIL